MKRLTLWVLAAPLLVFFQSKEPDVSGKWKLDLKKSENLPSSFAHVDSYTFEVSRSRDTLRVNAGLTGGGQTVNFPPFTYILDGSEVYRKDTLRESQRWSTGRWSKNRKNIVVDTRILLSPAGRPEIDISQHDVWTLVDSLTLEIRTRQKYSGSDSVRNELRIYRRAK